MSVGLRREFLLNNSPGSCIRAKNVVLSLTALLFCLPLLSQQGEDPRLEQAHQQNKSLPHYNRPGESLWEKLVSSGNTSITVQEVADRGGVAGAQPPAEQELLTAQVCQADAVLVGTIISSVSLLSNNETQVFTDYTVQPTDILKNDPKTPIAIGKSFLLTRPGGEVHLDIGNIRQIYREFPVLYSGKQSYLLFLTESPDTTTYKNTDAFSTYILHNDRSPQLILDSSRGEAQRRASFLSTSTLSSLRSLITSAADTCVLH